MFSLIHLTRVERYSLRLLPVLLASIELELNTCDPSIWATKVVYRYQYIFMIDLIVISLNYAITTKWEKYLLVLHTAGREAFEGTATGNCLGTLWAAIGRAVRNVIHTLDERLENKNLKKCKSPKNQYQPRSRWLFVFRFCGAASERIGAASFGANG
jgi:hypothetical protein